jgi:beta-xylosidase
MTQPPPSHRPLPAPPSPLPGYFADPNLAAFDGRYYLYPTTDGVPDWGAVSFRAFSSPDLVAWQDHGEILRLGTDVVWADGHAWAPAMAERDGRFYFYFTAEDSIGVASGDSPTGPFRDLGRPLVPRDEYPGAMIDPSVFRDDDGRYYLLWGNGWLHTVELGPDMASIDRSAVRSSQPTGFREAGWMHRRGDVYYLSWSENDTRDADYRIRYASGASPFGPWTDHGVLLEQDPARGILATGHHSILQVPRTDDWVIAYHRFGIPEGNGFRREVIIEPVEHRDGKLHVVPTAEPLRRPL